MVKVFYHLRLPKPELWRNDYAEFTRLPAIGEDFSLEPTGPVYRVGRVIHTPFEGGDLAGEIYAIEVDHNAEMKKFFPEG